MRGDDRSRPGSRPYEGRGGTDVWKAPGVRHTQTIRSSLLDRLRYVRLHQEGLQVPLSDTP